MSAGGVHPIDVCSYPDIIACVATGYRLRHRAALGAAGADQAGAADARARVATPQRQPDGLKAGVGGNRKCNISLTLMVPAAQRAYDEDVSKAGLP